MSSLQEREKQTLKMRRWRAANTDHWLAYQREYKKAARAADPETHRAKDRARYERDSERIKERLNGYRTARQAIIAELKTRPCADCGQSFHWAAMHFDHLPERGLKRFNISHAGTRYSLSVVMAEIEKCEVVCANCHAVRTYRRLTDG